MGTRTSGTRPWQSNICALCFFRCFPWVLRALNAFGVLPWYVLGCAVQLPLFAGCGAALYALAAQSYGPRAAARACIWLLAFPGTFFFALPMTESLFLLLCLGFFLLLQHGRPLAAGAAGFLCALARSPGALLCGAAAVWLWQAVRAKRVRLSPAYAVCVAGPVLGLLGYFLLNWAVFGDWLRFSEYQAQHWGQKLGFFWNTVAYHLDTMAQWWREGQRLNAVCISLLAVVCILYALGLLCAAAHRLQAHPFGLCAGLCGLHHGGHLAVKRAALPGGLFCAALRGRAVLPKAALGVAVLAGGPGRRGGSLLCRLPAPRASVLTA